MPDDDGRESSIRRGGMEMLDDDGQVCAGTIVRLTSF
jgi:hypothetical protein